jgi:hypothetical protein
MYKVYHKNILRPFLKLSKLGFSDNVRNLGASKNLGHELRHLGTRGLEIGFLLCS